MRYPSSAILSRKGIARYGGVSRIGPLSKGSETPFAPSPNHFCRRLNLSNTELECGSALGAFLQTPAPVLDQISGLMGAQFLSWHLSSRQATGSLQWEAIVSQNLFCDPVAVFAHFRAFNHGLKEQKPKTYCDNSSFAILSLTSALIVRSGPVWRQHLAILAPAGPRDSTCQP